MFAQNLARLRKDRSLTYLQLAGMAGVSAATVWRMERGLDVNFSSALKVANALGVGLADLVEDGSGHRSPGTAVLVG